MRQEAAGTGMLWHFNDFDRDSLQEYDYWASAVGWGVVAQFCKLEERLVLWFSSREILTNETGYSHWDRPSPIPATLLSLCFWSHFVHDFTLCICPKFPLFHLVITNQYYHSLPFLFLFSYSSLSVHFSSLLILFLYYSPLSFFIRLFVPIIFPSTPSLSSYFSYFLIFLLSWDTEGILWLFRQFL